MVSGDTLREAVARAICGCDKSGHVPACRRIRKVCSEPAGAALRAIVQAAGLDAEGLEHSARFVEHHGRYSDNAAALLRALASAAEPKP